MCAVFTLSQTKKQEQFVFQGVFSMETASQLVPGGLLGATVALQRLSVNDEQSPRLEQERTAGQPRPAPGGADAGTGSDGWTADGRS